MRKSLELHEPFHDRERQREADTLGMAVFLASEMMLFGGLFAGIFALRVMHPEALLEAESRMHMWIGAINTTILLTSSLTMAIAVQSAKAGRERTAAGWLTATALLGITFLGVKGYEYWLEYREGLIPGLASHGLEGPVEQLFMNLYLVSTGLHAVHLLIGIGAVAVIAILVRRTGTAPETVANVGLYWHLVDIIWIFLYPALYLMRS